MADEGRLASLIGGRRFIVLATVVLVLLPGLALLPHLRGMVSRNAVVSAFVHTARAPISGSLDELGPRAGERLEEDVAGWIVDPRADDELVSELRARSLTQHDLVGQLAAQRDILAALEVRQEATRSAYRDALSRDVARRITGVQSELDARQARLRELDNDVRRAQSLLADGVVAAARLEAATAELDAAEGQQQSQEALLARLEMARQELADERFMVEGLEGAVQLDADLRRLRMDLLTLERDHARATADLTTIAQRLERAENRYARQERAAIPAPARALVWQVNARQGQFVPAGAPVFSFVECDSLLLDMRLDDSVLSLVAPGQRVRFRLFGSRDWHEARVSLVRGSGAVMTEGSLATAVAGTSREGQVLAEIEVSEPFESPAEFCGIGRKAYARIEGVGLVQEFLRRIFL